MAARQSGDGTVVVRVVRDVGVEAVDEHPFRQIQSGCVGEQLVVVGGAPASTVIGELVLDVRDELGGAL